MSTTTDPPATLAAALAELQTKLPRIGKDKTAKVRTKTGADYTYDYANLATISHQPMPLMGPARPRVHLPADTPRRRQVRPRLPAPALVR